MPVCSGPGTKRIPVSLHRVTDKYTGNQLESSVIPARGPETGTFVSNTSQISVLKPSESAYKAAAAALARGELVILPTETIYGVFGDPESQQAIEGMTKIFGPVPVSLAGWHAPSLELALERANVTHPVHRRMLERLLPGPVGFIFESGDSVRVPDNAAALAVLQTAHDAGHTNIFSIGLMRDDFGKGDEIEPLLKNDSIRQQLTDAGVTVVIDVGQTALGRPSTILRFTNDGGYEITREGPVGERFISEQLRRRLLFVCTGNTCRSPMASAIAVRVLLEQGEPEDLFEVSSAGTMAATGAPMTPEAAQALRKLGYEPDSHESKPVTAADVQRADEIYGLTRSHVNAMKDAFPGAAWKVSLLDPDGNDIPDPIGLPASVYDETCRTLESSIRSRLVMPSAGAERQERGAGA